MPSIEVKKKIVMLGNSHVYRMQWDELLGREDVANRGIGSDMVEGFFHRLPLILQLNPRLCFIEGGVNDIERNVHIDSSMKYLRMIVDTLKNNAVMPVVIKVIHVADTYPEARSFNHLIDKFNHAIDIALSRREGVRILDLNPVLCANGTLLPAFAQEDGIHLTPEAYLIWKQQVLKMITEAGL
jgi:lysophospholipase L1-like esterase